MRHMLGDSALGIRSRLHSFEWSVIGDQWFAVLFRYVAAIECSDNQWKSRDFTVNPDKRSLRSVKCPATT